MAGQSRSKKERTRNFSNTGFHGAQYLRASKRSQLKDQKNPNRYDPNKDEEQLKRDIKDLDRGS